MKTAESICSRGGPVWPPVGRTIHLKVADMNCEAGPQIIERMDGRAPQAMRQCAGNRKKLPFYGNDFPALACSNDRGSMQNGPDRPDRIAAT
ncbi:hypothetical protein [Cereibacter sphaeroides]|uniref:hypothetical protein n=2 Tax=Cereibacter sphaeroides TaxID=1063 RepID=UPI001D0DC55C|nr:hypothetical protein [Cereibacter sphaeroides]